MLFISSSWSDFSSLQNIVTIIIMFIKWVIPDIPFTLKVKEDFVTLKDCYRKDIWKGLIDLNGISFQEKIRREKYITNELVVTNELLRARGLDAEDTGERREPALYPHRSPLKRNFSEPTRSEVSPGLRLRAVPPVEDPEQNDSGESVSGSRTEDILPLVRLDEKE